MAKSEEMIGVLQRFVDGYVEAIGGVTDALTDEQTPVEARRVLAGALNYVLDLLDIFPDHYKGLGVADDAMLLRLGAKLAVEAGAKQGALKQLAEEAAEVEPLLGELMAPLEKYVAKLPERTVRGRTVAQILGDKVVFGVFAADVQRQVSAYKPQAIDTSAGVDWVVGEVRRMVKHELKKAGLIQ
jgi:uncharacterized membrane protein YkvA (DUF1232 family)